MKVPLIDWASPIETLYERQKSGLRRVERMLWSEGLGRPKERDVTVVSPDACVVRRPSMGGEVSVALDSSFSNHGRCLPGECEPMRQAALLLHRTNILVRRNLFCACGSECRANSSGHFPADCIRHHAACVRSRTPVWEIQEDGLGVAV